MPSLFDECLLDPNLLTGATGSPEFANTVIRNPASGVYKTNVNRFDPTEVLTIDMTLLTATEQAYLINFWRGGYGNAVGFRVRIPYDYFVTLEAFALGAVAATTFYLYNTYTRPGVTARQDVRRIVKPVNDTPAQLTNLGGAGGSVRLYEADGVTARVITRPFKIYFGDTEQTTGWTVNNTTGLVTFAVAPPPGTVIKWSGEFDVPMAFLPNSFNQKYDVSSEVQGLTLREILYSELGV